MFERENDKLLDENLTRLLDRHGATPGLIARAARRKARRETFGILRM